MALDGELVDDLQKRRLNKWEGIKDDGRYSYYGFP